MNSIGQLWTLGKRQPTGRRPQLSYIRNKPEEGGRSKGMARAVVPSPTVSRRSGFVPGDVSCCSVYSGVVINWLNGQRFSTFHFIRDNGLCTEGRMKELLFERGEGKREREIRKTTFRRECVVRENAMRRLIFHGRFLHERSILSERFSFPLS